MSLTVLEPGLYSVLVDLGRPASRSLGVPMGGAADRAAQALGNALVGNSEVTTALEVTLAGPTLRAEARTAGVLFGAPFELSLSGREPLSAGTTFTMEAGEVLQIGGTPDGVRGYFCVEGGFDSPTILGGRSGLEPVRAGELLRCRESAGGSRRLPFLTSADAWGGDRHVLRVLDGPQRDWFLDDTFFTTSYTVTPASNRMGLRLSGASLTRRPGELVSEAVAPGAVQVANDGLPIVIGVDGQTIGGYPKIAHVIRADLDLLGQLRPGAEIRFQRVRLAEADTAARERAQRLRDWLVRLRIVAAQTL